MTIFLSGISQQNNLIAKIGVFQFVLQLTAVSVQLMEAVRLWFLTSHEHLRINLHLVAACFSSGVGVGDVEETAGA